MPLTPDSSAPGSPYDYHSLGWCTTSSFEQFPDALEVPQMHEVSLRHFCLSIGENLEMVVNCSVTLVLTQFVESLRFVVLSSSQGRT